MRSASITSTVSGRSPIHSAIASRSGPDISARSPIRARSRIASQRARTLIPTQPNRDTHAWARGERGLAMRVLAGFTHSRAHVVGTGAIVALSIFVPSPLSPSIAAKTAPPTPFDSNGYDDSFGSRRVEPRVRSSTRRWPGPGSPPKYRRLVVTQCGGRSARRWRGRSCRYMPSCSPTGG